MLAMLKDSKMRFAFFVLFFSSVFGSYSYLQFDKLTSKQIPDMVYNTTLVKKMLGKDYLFYLEIKLPDKTNAYRTIHVTDTTFMKFEAGDSINFDLRMAQVYGYDYSGDIAWRVVCMVVATGIGLSSLLISYSGFKRRARKV